MPTSVERTTRKHRWRGYCLVGAKRDCYQVTIKVGGKTRHVGRFKSELEAAKAFDAAIHRYGVHKAKNFTDMDLIISVVEADDLKLNFTIFSFEDAMTVLLNFRTN